LAQPTCSGYFWAAANLPTAGAGDALLGEVHVDYGVELVVVLGDAVDELAVDGAQVNQDKSNK